MITGHEGRWKIEDGRGTSGSSVFPHPSSIFLRKFGLIPVTLFIFSFFSILNSAHAGVIVSDAFTETVTTALASHVPTIAGTGWTEDQDTCTSTYNADASDFARPNADLANCIMMYSAQPDPTVSRYDVQVSFIDAQVVAATDCMGVFGRWTDTSNYYSLGVCDDSGLAYRMYKRVANVSTNLVTNAGAFSNNDTDVVIFQLINKAKRAFENGTLIISNSDNTLTSAGKAGIWCGQVQVANDDCDTTGQRFDNFSVTTYPTQIVDADIFTRDAYAADEVIHTGRWYISPVVHVGDVRTPKIGVIDKNCSWSAGIGDADVENEWSLVYTSCKDYQKLDTDKDLTLVYEGDIDRRVSQLSEAQQGRLMTSVIEKSGNVKLSNDRPAYEWLNQLGKKIKPEFNAEDIYVIDVQK